jgi:signal transduction histidine kinase
MATAVREANGPGMHPASMLVVDDDSRGRRLLEGFLSAEGYRVRTAPDGATALALARAEAPDVVLLDVMMPEMSGYEVCAALKSDGRTRFTQVMLVTALDGIPDKVMGLDTGADDYVTKPVRREEFLAKVRALLRARSLLVDLERARAELAAKNRELDLKRTLAQTLVHDLKCPLTAVLGNLDLLDLRVGEQGEAGVVVSRCRESASRMLSMILNLLDVEGLDEGKLVPRQERIETAGLVASAADEAQVAAAQAGVVLAVDTDDAADVVGDCHLLRRVIDNLVANAVRHSPRGGTITVALCRRAEGVEIVVSDEGPGIAPEHRESVFDKYHQLELRREGIVVNRGLGLTFCRLAVEAHGGTIWIDETEGGGARFHVLLPPYEETFAAAAAVPAGVHRVAAVS